MFAELAQGALDDHSILVYVARLYQVFHQNPPIEEKETVKSNNDKVSLTNIECYNNSGKGGLGLTVQ